MMAASSRVPEIDEPPSDAVWYFAYGSNLCRAIFIERRGMRPLAARCARLDGHRLCFDLPVGPGERGVANVELDAADHVWGVAYLLRAEDFERLDRTEGVHRGFYTREAVTVTTEDGASIAGFTYRSPFSTAGRKPSARYLGLLLDGARSHGLPAEYVARLEALELAVDERLAKTDA
jgi:cation transport regulator ChaC